MFYNGSIITVDSQIQELKDYLLNTKILDDYALSVLALKHKYEQYSKIITILSTLKMNVEKLNMCNTQIADLDNQINVYSNLSDLVQKYKKLSDMYNLLSKINKMSQMLDILLSTSDKFVDECNLYNSALKLNDKFNSYISLDMLHTKLFDLYVDLGSISEDLKDVKSIKLNVGDTQKYLDLLYVVNHNTILCTRLKNVDIEISALDKQYATLHKYHGLFKVCPLCNSPLN